MNTFLLVALTMAILAGLFQSLRLRYCQHDAAYYQGMSKSYERLWNGAEQWVTTLRRLAQLQKVTTDRFSPYNRQLQLLQQHPKLTAKKLRRILNAHQKRQYMGGEHYSDRGSICNLMSAAAIRRKWIYKHGKDRPESVVHHIAMAKECHVNVSTRLKMHKQTIIINC